MYMQIRRTDILLYLFFYLKLIKLSADSRTDKTTLLVMQCCPYLSLSLRSCRSILRHKSNTLFRIFQALCFYQIKNNFTKKISILSAFLQNNVRLQLKCAVICVWLYASSYILFYVYLFSNDFIIISFLPEKIHILQFLCLFVNIQRIFVCFCVR